VPFLSPPWNDLVVPTGNQMPVIRQHMGNKSKTWANMQEKPLNYRLMDN
jgi:hypothetical protein